MSIRVWARHALLLAGLLPTVLGAPMRAGAQAAPPVANPTDVASIDAIIDALYAVISGPAGQARDWARFHSLFADGARLIPTAIRPDGSRMMMVWTPQEYVERAGATLERNGFFEKEIGRVTEEFGQIAHVFSAYDSKRTQVDPEPFARGINSIQLRHDGTRWYVVTVFWDSERPDNPISSRYLGR